MHAINELLESERSYISSLRKIIEDYVPELGRLDVPQSLRGQVHNLFGNIEPIFNFHCYRFLPELLVSITENNDKEENPTIAQLLKNMSQCFLKNRASFDLYKSYWENKPKSDVLLENKEARAFLQKRQMQLGDKLDLSSFLLKPVQRLTKYQQILRAIIDILMSLHSYLLKKNTVDGEETVKSEDFSEIKCEELDLLNQAEDMIKWFLRQGNDILAAELIKDCPWNYKTEGGRLIRQDNLHQVVGSKLSVRRVFLFEKLIIICKPKLEFSHLTDTNQRFVFKDGLKTNEFGLTRRKESNSAKNPDKRFEIWQTLPTINGKTNSLTRFGKKVGLAKKFNTRMNSFIFEAENEDQKNLWVQDIETLHWEQMNVFRQQRQNVSFGLIDLNKESNESIRDRSVVVRLRNKNNLVTQNQNNNNNIAERRFSTGARLQHYIRPLETSLEETSLDEKTDSVDSVSVKTRPVSMMLPTNIPRTVLSSFKRNSKERASSVFSNSFKYIDKNPVKPIQVQVPLFNFNHKPKIGGGVKPRSPTVSPNSDILRKNAEKKRVLPNKTRPYSIVSINSSSSGNSSAGPVFISKTVLPASPSGAHTETVV